MGSLAPCLTPTYNLGQKVWELCTFLHTECLSCVFGTAVALPSSHPGQSCLVRIWSSHSSTLFFLDHDVSGKLPTYPSPKPTFCPKWEVSAYVGLGEGWVGSFSAYKFIMICFLGGEGVREYFFLPLLSRAFSWNYKHGNIYFSHHFCPRK